MVSAYLFPSAARLFWSIALRKKKRNFADYYSGMGTLRLLLRKNCWTSGALWVALLLWVGGGTALSSHCSSTKTAAEREVRPQATSDDVPGDQDDDRDVLTSLEAVVAPVAKLHFVLVGGFKATQVVYETTESAFAVLTFPQSNYLRTLFRLITPANAP